MVMIRTHLFDCEGDVTLHRKFNRRLFQFGSDLGTTKPRDLKTRRNVVRANFLVKFLDDLVIRRPSAECLVMNVAKALVRESVLPSSN